MSRLDQQDERGHRGDELERAIGALRESAPTPEAEAEALDRVAERLRRESGEIGGVLNCEDIQQLAPALERGDLRPERAQLVRDHLRSCLVCRRARPTGSSTPAEPSDESSDRRRWLWGLAAGLVVGVLLAQFLLVQRSWPGAAGEATLELIEGTLLAVPERGEVRGAEGTTGAATLGAGDVAEYGESLLVPRGQRAVVELADGSRLELNERSRWSAHRDRGGTTIELEGGNVIVEAAEQRDGELYVATDDCLVSVTGTVFAVNSGTRGSRVSVFEGEVRVDERRHQRVLRAGDQTTTNPTLVRTALAEEVAWSADPERYLVLLAEVNELNRELRALERPDLRYASPFLDRLPPRTAIYVALPNLGESLQDGLEQIEERLTTSTVLAEWWRRHEELGDLEELARSLSEVAETLGEEIAIVAWLDGSAGTRSERTDELAGPVLVAEVVDSAALRTRLEDELTRLEDESGEEIPVRIVADPRFTPDVPSGEPDELVVWIGDRHVVATHEVGILASFAQFMTKKRTSFYESSFHSTIAERYEDGVETLAALDLEALLGREADAEERAELDRLGLSDVRHLVVERWVDDGRAETRVVLNFAGSRRGVPSWLAAPAPMPSLGYLSPDTATASAVVFREPRLLVDELLAAMSDERRSEFLAELAVFEAEHDWNPVDDLVDTLGGELAIAVDGPLVPEPAWKLVVEVYDPARLQVGIERLVADLDARLREKEEGEVTLSERGDGYRATIIRDDDSGQRTREIHYAFDGGFLVATPSAALLERALTYRDADYNLLESDRLRALLASDEEVNVSGLFYQDFSRVLEPLAGLLGDRAARARAEMTPEQQRLLDEIEEGFGPMLVTAYGEEDRIVLSSTSSHNPLGLLRLLLAGGGIGS